MMTNRQIEQSREIRMWLSKVVIPGVLTTASALYAIGVTKNDVRDFANDKRDVIKNLITKIFKK